ncbi:hypothetical protein M9H77_17216 [Catharanthus roseus]|uniref:Uncharacterized protein n=1 Tax=Catharanthus roseus TaxID=4058 RepID=A0ACC0B405_CATRO|nr:hypothetical protein M9H77_17216 [Catharanthus roseus]
MVDELLRIKELPQAKIEKSLLTHVEKEISNNDSCDNMNDKNIEKESIEIEGKDRVEEKERLVERLCVFGSMSTLFKKCEKHECEKEKEIDTISFFTPTYLCFEHLFIKTKLNSLALIFYRISLEHPCSLTSKLGKNHTIKSEDQGENH